MMNQPKPRNYARTVLRSNVLVTEDYFAEYNSEYNYFEISKDCWVWRYPDKHNFIRHMKRISIHWKVLYNKKEV